MQPSPYGSLCTWLASKGATPQFGRAPGQRVPLGIALAFGLRARCGTPPAHRPPSLNPACRSCSHDIPPSRAIHYE